MSGTGLVPPDISVSPDSLDVALFTGDTVTRIVTIANTGGSSLYFDISLEGVDKSAVSVTAKQKSTGMSIISGENNSAAESLSKASSSQRPTNSLAGPRNIFADRIISPKVFKHDNRFSGEILRTIPAPGSVLGLTYFNNSLWAVVNLGIDNNEKMMRLDPQNGSILDSFDLGIDLYVGLTNDGANLWVGSFTSNRIKKYSTSGELLASWPCPIQPSGLAWDGEALWAGRYTSLVRLDTNGVTLDTRELPYGTAGYMMDMEWVPKHAPCALWLVDLDYGKASQYDITTDSVVLCQDFPLPDPYLNPTGIAHDGKNLWVSGFDYSVIYLIDDGIDELVWLSTIPEQGTVPVNDSIEIAVTFNAEGLYGGDYNARIMVNSNDPDESEIGIAAHLKVTGAPVLAVSKDTLDFGEAFAGSSRTDTLLVKNEGTDLLSITEITSDNPDFSVSPSAFDLAPTDSQIVAVVFSPPDSGVTSGNLTIMHNVPEQPVKLIAVRGHGVLPPDITVSSLSFDQALLTGQTALDTMMLSNDGYSDLIFNISKHGADRISARPIVLNPASGRSKLLPNDKALKQTQVTAASLSDSLQHRPPRSNDVQTTPSSPKFAGEYSGTYLHFGISAFGEIMPFQYPDGNEHLANGAYLSGYTVAYMANGNDNVKFAGYDSRYGIVPVSYQELIIDSSEAVIEVITETDDGYLRIIRTFTFNKSDKYIGINTELENSAGATALESVVFKSFADWDVDASYDNNWDYDLSHNMCYAYQTKYVAIAGDRPANFMDINGWDDYTGRFTDVDYPSGPVYSFDGFEILHYEMGDIGAGSSTQIVTAFGAGDNLPDLQTAIEHGLNAASWLKVAPTAGLIPAGESLAIEVAFDASGMYGGDYYADIQVTSNDPDESEISVPVHLNVTGAPVIAVSNDSINYGDVFIGAVKTDSLIIYNQGTDLLTVSDIAIDNPTFAVDSASFSLPPGKSRQIYVTYSPAAASVDEAKLTISSNDTNHPEYTVYLTGTGLVAPVISVNPDSLHADLLTGQQVTQKLTVTNSGGSDLIYEIKFKRVNLPDSLRVRKPGENRALISGPADSSNLTVTPDSKRTDSVPRAEAPVIRSPHSSKGVNVLVFRDWWPWGYKVNVPILQSLGANVTTATSYEMATIDLSLYDLIVIESDQPYDFYSRYATNLSHFESFLSSGGIIEFHCAMNANYPNLPLPGGMRTLYYLDYDSYNQIYDYTHPIVAGATEPLWGSSASHVAFENIPAGADTIVVNESGLPTLVEYSYGQGTLIATGMTWEIGYIYGWNSAIPLLPNALQYSFELAGGVKWLSADVQSGIIPPEGSSEININFNAAGMYGGDYAANIRFLNNDPINPALEIPASMHVTGAPVISVSPDTLRFDTIFQGLTTYDTIVVRNVGSDLLKVTEIASDNPAFTVGVSSFDLSPQESRNVVVAFAPVDSGYVEGKLSITSNDQGQSEYTVFLYGTGLYPPQISVSPDSLKEYLYSNQIVVDTVTISNSGLSDLLFSISTVPQKDKSDISSGKNVQIRAIGSHSLSYDGDINKIQSQGGSPCLPPRIARISSDLSQAGLSPERPPTGAFPESSLTRNTALPLYDGFEDGDLNGWNSWGNGINEATNSYAAAGEYSFHNFNLDSANCSGISQSFEPGSRPSYCGFYVRYASTNRDAGYTYMSTGSPDYYTAFWFYGGYDGRLHMNSGSGGDESYSYLPNHWYHIVLDDIDWSAKSFDYYVDGVLVKQDISFWNNGNVDQFGELNLYNCSGVGQSWWDEVIVGDIVPYITILPTSGLVQPGTSIDVEVTFNATGLSSGNFFSDLIINSNDPVAGAVTVPTHMHVIGAPDIDVSADSLNYGDVYLGSTAIDTLIIKNTGTEILLVNEIVSDNPYFAPENDSFNLDPGAQRPLQVAFAPTEEGFHEGTLKIISNDPEENEDTVIVYLTGQGYIPPIISVTPDSIGAIISSGQTVTRTLTISNSGGRESNFRISILGANIIDSARALSRLNVRQNEDFGARGINIPTAAPAQSGKLGSDSDRTGSNPSRSSESNPSHYITPSAGDVIRTIPAPGKTLGLTYMRGSLWAVVDTKPQEKIVEINPDDGTVLSSFSIGYGLYLGLTNDGENFWVSDFAQGSVKKFSPEGALMTSWSAPNGFDVRGIAWDSSSLWIGGADCGYLIRTDTSGNILEMRDLPSNQIGWGLDMEWVPVHVGGELWMIDDWNSNDINQFNIAPDPVILLQDFPHPAPSLAPEGIAHDGENLWISAYNSSVLYLVDDGLKELCWLKAEPEFGVVPAGESREITITYDATYLDPGEYNAEIKISNDDPLNQIITVPADMRVVGTLLCGRVKDTIGNSISGATVEIWDNFPDGNLLKIISTDSSGSFACDSIDAYSFDAYAHCAGYYPAFAENIDINNYPIEMILTPVAHITATTEATFFYCADNTYFGAPLPSGSVVDAYDPDGILCGSWYVTSPGRYGLMPVYRDDFTTPEIDEGAEPGDTLTFLVNGMPTMTSAQPIWTENGDRREVCLTVSEMQEKQIVLSEGWNLVSWNLDTPDDNIESVLAPIMDCIEIVLGFDSGGLIYNPDLPQFSTLLSVDHLHGYWIKMNCPRTLTIIGRPVPTSTPIDLQAGWNLVSYLPCAADSTPEALESVLENLIIALGFNNGGFTYDPGLPQFSTLTTLGPGFGYWLKVTADDVLVYPGAGPKVIPAPEDD